MTHDLTPLDPRDAVDLYLAQREEDSSARTAQAHEYRLNHFLRWCDEEDITNVNDLSGRLLYEYRQWRRKDGDLNTVSLRTQLSTLRKFVRFLEQVDGVEPNLHEKIVLPTLDDGEDARDDLLEADRAEEILSHFQRFEYASKTHVLLTLLWETSMRMGAVHSLDVKDFDADARSLRICHRPDEGSYLKNKERGERIISLTEGTCEVIQDWIAYNRPDVTDDHGRKPLVATKHGRISKSNLRAVVYHNTRPCQYGGDCQCAEQHNYSYASRCEHSRSPHACRRGSLTHLLRNDVPKAVVSDRADVSPDVLDEHYNQMTEEEKMEQRREYLGDM